MNTAKPPLGDMPAERFLRDHWQKRPLLVRNAYPDFHCPLQPEELAGLACEAEVEARLVLEKHGSKPWELRHGPFSEHDFTSLPTSHWTLLLQELNKYIPAAALLLDDFNFIPGWRVDDLMASYAADQGSVGPHTDQYDVFLIQAWGTRRWQISSAPAGDQLLPDTELALLAEFDPEQEWLLHPGDLLYLPPGVAHHGVAAGPCMTFSVGFRAPALAALVESFAEQRIEQLDPELLYADPELQPQPHSGAIGPEALARIRKLVRDTLGAGDADIDHWFGRQMSLPQRGEASAPRSPPLSPGEFLQRLQQGATLWRSDYSRFSFIEHDHGLTLFVDGRDYPLPAALLPAIDQLTSQRRPDFSHNALPPELASLLTELYNRNALLFEDDD